MAPNRTRGRAGLAFGLALLTTACTSAARPPTPTPAFARAATESSYIGRHWVLAAVDHQGRHVVIPPGSKAWIEFEPSGRFAMSDTANGAGGRFSTTSTGFLVSEAGSTYVGVATEGPRAVAARAMQGILGFGDPAGASTARKEIAARVVHDTLVLEVGHDVLSFTRR